MTQQKFFDISLPSKKLRFRNIFKIKKDGKLDFTIQLEVELKAGEWKPLVRWDCAHGSCHRNLIHSNGHKEKDETTTQELDKVIENGIDNLKENLKSYLEKTGYRELSNSLPSHIDIERDLEGAKRFLLDLVKHPEKIDSTTSHGRLKLEMHVTLKNEVALVKRSR